MEKKTLQDYGQDLLDNIKFNIAALEELKIKISGEWQEEDAVYRFYHGSFKVYRLQALTKEIVQFLATLDPKESKYLATYFNVIVDRGTNLEFDLKHNGDWLGYARPILEAFWHAKYFLEMCIKYGKELEKAPRTLPSGWSAALYLYCIR